MLYVLTGLFCLFFTATSYCNSLWPAFMTSTLIFNSGQATSSWTFWALASLLFFIFVSLETYLYHWFLKGTSYVQALRYAIAANITTLLVTLAVVLSIPLFFEVFGLFKYILDVLIHYNIISNIDDPRMVYIIFFVTLITLIEFTIMRLITNSTKKIVIPVLSGYVLTIAIFILAHLLFGLQK